MTAQPLTRSIVVMALAFVVLLGVLGALGQISDVRAERFRVATDYTVGGLCGATIQACINNPIVVNGDRILIPTDTYTESLTLDKAVSLIGVDASTTVIHAVSGQRVITVTGSIITATTVISGVTITGGNVTSNYSYPAGAGGGVFLDNAAQPLLQNVVISDNHAFWGGGLNTSSDLTMTNVSVFNNSAQDGGGVNAGYQVYLIGGQFKGNRAQSMEPGAGEGGGLRAGRVWLIGTDFISNTASELGGGAYVGSLAIVFAGQFMENHAGQGGGLCVAGDMILTATKFINNTAGIVGGAWAGCRGSPTSSASIVSARFENNRGATGGGLYVGQSMDTVLTVSDTQFISNTAEFDGGGVSASGKALVTGGRFEGNTAGGNGAGLYAVELYLTGTVMLRNTAVGSGGGILCCGWNRGGRIVNAQLTSNTAGSGGAGIHAGEVGMYLAVLHTTIADMNLNPKSGMEAYAQYPGALGITDTIITSHTVGIKVGGGGTVREDYNLFFGNISDRSGTIITGTHDVRGNPRFIDPAADDYHLAPGSAAVDQGVYVGVKTDLDGNSRLRDYGGLGPDIGAYEYHFQGVIYDTYLPLVRK